MPEDIPLLDQVRVAAPCPANWNEMVGGDRVRYCRACEKNVYNLSEMSKNDAEKLLQTHEGRLCIRYYRRADGNIMTNNCPVGLRTIPQGLPENGGGRGGIVRRDVWRPRFHGRSETRTRTSRRCGRY